MLVIVLDFFCGDEMMVLPQYILLPRFHHTVSILTFLLDLFGLLLDFHPHGDKCWIVEGLGSPAVLRVLGGSNQHRKYKPGTQNRSLVFDLMFFSCGKSLG